MGSVKRWLIEEQEILPLGKAVLAFAAVTAVWACLVRPEKIPVERAQQRISPYTLELRLKLGATPPVRTEVLALFRLPSLSLGAHNLRLSDRAKDEGKSLQPQYRAVS